MRQDSPAVPAGKLARNIVAGALNRKDIDAALFAEIRFVAYALEEPADKSSEEAYRILRIAGFETARASILTPSSVTPEYLSALFSKAESTSQYQLDGIVVAPNVPRLAAVNRTANPPDRVAWKTRIASQTATAKTTVRAVEWNVSHGGMLIPRVLFDTVTLAGAAIGAATGLHGRWIYANGVGPGAVIEVRRAGDVIPQIIAVHTAVSPSMPTEEWAWASPDAEESIHIKPVTQTDEHTISQLRHALTELGAENVGPGIVAKLFAAGFKTLRQIFGASVEDLMTVEGFRAAAAQRTYDGLRVGSTKWTDLTLMVASCCLPRAVGRSKITLLLELNPNPASWNAEALIAARPAGLSAATIEAIVATIPAYLAWKAANFPGLVLSPALSLAPSPAPSSAPSPSLPKTNSKPMNVVLTGFRDKALEAALVAAGHSVSDTVTKKTTHVVHSDTDSDPTSTKTKKAESMGIPVLKASALRSLLISH